MKLWLPAAIAVLGLAMMAAPAGAIDVTPGAYADADATVGRDVVDDNDVIVKPCDCEPVANPGQFRVFRENGSLVMVHYEAIEGTPITTTDGTVVGTVISVQNAPNRQILLLVRVEPGLLGAVDRINIRRNAFYWTGSAAVIDTTIDDLRASIQAAGVGA